MSLAAQSSGTASNAALNQPQHYHSRLEALRLATAHGGEPSDIITRASVYYQFLKGGDA